MFTGDEVLFFVYGVLGTLLVIGLVTLARKFNFKWYTILLATLGGLLALFTLAWSLSSVIEGEIQAAYMGLVIFGIPVLIIGGLTRQLVIRDRQKS